MPCVKRIKELTTSQTLVKEEGFEGTWVLPTANNPSEEKNAVIDIDEEESKEKKEFQDFVKKEQKEGVIKDLDEIDKEEDEKNVFIQAPKASEAEVCATRAYDLSITYDFYYQVPRLWLTGYGEGGAPLTKEQMYEDIMADYAEKTVTLEKHVHQGIECLSIHPCKHSAVMNHIIDTIAANGGKAEVRSAMFVFLKFIASIIPTIRYDYTVDMKLE